MSKDMTPKALLEIEKAALDYVRAGNNAAAAELFAEIVEICPDWEHGNAAYSLACCLEDLGNLGEAELNFKLALACEPNNSYFLSGYASFLYLHGDASRAIDAYLKFIKSEGCSPSVVNECRPVLEVLAVKQGLSRNELAELLSRTCSEFLLQSNTQVIPDTSPDLES